MVTKSMVEHFRRLYVCGPKDTSTFSVSQHPSIPPVINVQVQKHHAQVQKSAAPKFPPPEPAYTNNNAPRAAQRLRLPGAPKFNPKERGLFY